MIEPTDDAKVIHDRESGDLAPEFMTDRDLLVYVAKMIARLEPLIATLEQFATVLPSPGENGKKPGAFSMAMAAAKMARPKDA